VGKSPESLGNTQASERSFKAPVHGSVSGGWVFTDKLLKVFDEQSVTGTVPAISGQAKTGEAVLSQQFGYFIEQASSLISGPDESDFEENGFGTFQGFGSAAENLALGALDVHPKEIDVGDVRGFFVQGAEVNFEGINFSIVVVVKSGPGFHVRLEQGAIAWHSELEELGFTGRIIQSEVGEGDVRSAAEATGEARESGGVGFEADEARSRVAEVHAGDFIGLMSSDDNDLANRLGTNVQVVVEVTLDVQLNGFVGWRQLHFRVAGVITTEAAAEATSNRRMNWTNQVPCLALE